MREPPNNRLEKLIYNIERVTLSPVAAIAEEAYRRDQGYPSRPYLEAMEAGFREAQTFDSFVKNPWLAFALNVGGDVTTWIPGTWLAKATKGATKVLGVETVANYVRGLEHIDKLDSKFGKYFRGPSYEIRKRNPQAISDMLTQRNIDFDDFISTFVDDMAEVIVMNTANDEEAFRLSRLLLQRRPAKTLDQSMKQWSPEYIEEYKKLSEKGKTAYRLAWEHARTIDAIKANRQMRAMDTYEVLKDRVSSRYKSMVENPHQMLANELKLDQVLKGMDNFTIEDVVNKLAPSRAVDEVVQLMPDIDVPFQKLAAIAVKSGSLSRFKTAVRQLPKKSFEATVVKNMNRDEAIDEFRLLYKQLVNDRGEVAAHDIAKTIIDDPKSRYAQLYKKITGRKPQTEIFEKRKQIPSIEEIEMIVNRMPKSTPYSGIDDFYRRVRVATDIGDEQLQDVLSNLARAMPMELNATMSIPEIIKARAEILGMKDPESIKELKQAWDVLNKHRFQGNPLNVLRTGNMDQIAKVNLNQIELRMAEMLKAEGVAMARAISNDNYHRRLFQWLRENELIISAEDMKDLKKRTEYFKALKKRLGPEEFAKRQREGFTEVVAHPIFKGMAIPKSLADDINSFTSVAGDPRKREQMAEIFGKWQGLWKAFTLAYFPSYHARNMISNIWNNFLGGLDDPRDIKYYARAFEIQERMSAGRNAAKKVGKFGGDYSPEDAALIRDLRRGVVGGEYAGELSRVLERSNPFRHGYLGGVNERVSKLFKPGWAVGRYAEDNARIAHYLKMRDGKGMSHLDAVKSVNKYLFDYRRGLTQFEDKYLRGVVFPFYAWTRFNMPLQLEMLGMQYGKFAGAVKLKDAVESQWGGPTPDETFQADWFKRAFNVRVRHNAETGNYEYFFLDSWLPAADINKLLDPGAGKDAFVSLLTPGKVPFELAFNYNTFRKRPIEKYPGQRLPIALPGGKTLELPAKMEFVARQLRLVNEVDRFLDETVDLSDRARWMRFLLGRSYPYNPDEQVNWWLWKLNTQIRELKGEEARARDKGREEEADRIQQLIDQLEETKAYYE